MRVLWVILVDLDASSMLVEVRPVVLSLAMHRVPSNLGERYCIQSCEKMSQLMDH